MSERNYWGYRIKTNEIDFFYSELKKGRLRQGWGYDEGQKLPECNVDEGAKRNLSMYKKVKKGDILLVPRLPEWDKVAIVKATEDWDKGYKYEIDDKKGDFGHIFPAEIIKSFKRKNQFVSGSIRSSLTNRSRFWNMLHLKEDIEKIRTSEETDDELTDIEKVENIISKSFNEIFDRERFLNKAYEDLIKSFSAAEWEEVITYGLKLLYPNYEIEKIGGKKEEEHGTDIIVKIPGILSEDEYGIAIQVKDYKDTVNNPREIIEQIKKSDKYFVENLKIIDKILLIISAEKEKNEALNELSEKEGIKVIYRKDFKDLIGAISQEYIGLKNF